MLNFTNFIGYFHLLPNSSYLVRCKEIMEFIDITYFSLGICQICFDFQI